MEIPTSSKYFIPKLEMLRNINIIELRNKIELFGGKEKEVERVMRIELTRPAWKAGVLPLNYTRSIKEVVI